MLATLGTHSICRAQSSWPRPCKKPALVAVDSDSDDAPLADFDHPAECPQFA